MSTQKPIDTAELQSDILSNAPQQTSQVDRHSDQKIRGTERDALSPSSPNHFAQSNQHVDEGNSDLDAQPYITETEDLRRSRIPLYRQSRQEDGVSELASEYHVHVSEDEILQLKRKQEAPKGEPAQDLHEDSDEEVDTALNKGRPSGNDKKRWIWKKRKGDNGLVCYDLPQSISSIVGNGRAVVKQSLDPQHALWESMVEMIVGNGLWELGNLEFLLYCYLSLNEPHLHPIIQSSFLQALRDLERIT
ncbi:hypothetical protein KP509_29G044100 [Ceratopteris richardii]|nr:hypothetical protein KP509_29G044100 [Ceratopteris richardii]